MAPLPERPPAALMLGPVVWSPSPSSPDRIRDPRASNHAAPCPPPTALSPCHLCKTNSLDKRWSLADPACRGGSLRPEGRRQKAEGRKNRLCRARSTKSHENYRNHSNDPRGLLV